MPASTPSSSCPSARGVAIVAAFFLLLLLLNAPAMERSASKLEFGKKRDVAMRLMKPLASLARFCRYDSVRHAAERVESAYLE